LNFKILVYGHYRSTDNVFLNSEEKLVTSIKNLSHLSKICHIYQKLVTSIKYLSHLSKTCHIYQTLVTSIKNFSHLSKTCQIYQKLVTSIKNLSHLSKTMIYGHYVKHASLKFPFSKGYGLWISFHCKNELVYNLYV
jgi:hypothetical protein